MIYNSLTAARRMMDRHNAERPGEAPAAVYSRDADGAYEVRIGWMHRDTDCLTLVIAPAATLPADAPACYCERA